MERTEWASPLPLTPEEQPAPRTTEQALADFGQAVKERRNRFYKRPDAEARARKRRDDRTMGELDQ